MKVFLAHSKGTTDLEIQFWSTAIVRWYAERGEAVEVVPGVDDFNSNISSDGTFDAWAKAVPYRHDTFTGLRLYGTVIVPQREVGKATAIIAQEAINAGLDVFIGDIMPDDTVEFEPASGVKEVDPRDYFRGWEVVGYLPD